MQHTMIDLKSVSMNLTPETAEVFAAEYKNMCFPVAGDCM